MRLLADKGLSLDDIIEVAACEERRSDQTNAQRQARHRARKRNAVTVTPLPPNEIDNLTPGDSPHVDADASTPPLRNSDGYHRLPENWTPTKPVPAAQQAKLDQWPPGAIESELTRLRLWAANASNDRGKGRKKDWDKAWWNWIERRHDEHYGRQRSANGLGRHQPSDGLSPTTRAAERVFGVPFGAGRQRAVPQ